MSDKYVCETWLNHIESLSLHSLDEDILLYKLDSSAIENIRAVLEKKLSRLQKKELSHSVSNILLEFIRHALIFNYRYVFKKYMIQEFGWGDLPRSEWMEIFEEELNSKKADNFAVRCKEANHPVILSVQNDRGGLSITVTHDGEYDSEEIQDVRTTMGKIKELPSSPVFPVADPLAAIEKFRPGLPLGLLYFQGLGHEGKKLKIFSRRAKTCYNLFIPLHSSAEVTIKVNKDDADNSERIFRLFRDLQYNLIVFDLRGNLSEISAGILEQLGISEDEVSILQRSIPDTFIQEIFYGPFSIHNFSHFENYRLRIQNKNISVLYNVSGSVRDSELITLWQPVQADRKKNAFVEGAVFQNAHLIKMVSPYIPKMVLAKAKETLQKGQMALPVENIEATVLFADLVGFTRMSEKLPHEEVLELLNQAMKIVVTSIERNGGFIDKFIGDGVMAIFFKPQDAVLGALEIQNNFINLNEFREISGESKIELRIGINTGQVILGSVGSGDRLDWTALGDVVNTAARIESVGIKNKVLVGESTYSAIQDKVVVESVLDSALKGKNRQQKLYFIQSMDVEKEGRIRTLSLNEV